MERPETFSTELAPGEPAPPASGELFAGHEVAAFESFLDNLATENEFLFHPKVPASLSWNGFHTTKNQGFDEFKHSGLQFGSDTHFSTTNGYVATHKYVPVGYGHVHPQSSAQRNQRSSTSSRTASRRPSIYSDPVQTSPLPYRQSLSSTHNNSMTNNSNSPNLAGPNAFPRDERISAHDSRVTYFENRGKSDHGSSNEDSRQREFQRQGMQAQSDYFRVPEGSPRVAYSQTMKPANYSSFPSVPTHVSPMPDVKQQDSSEADSAPLKKIKIEDGAGKQPLTSAQKRQNHISSEQRRRNLIKEGFNELSNMIPSVVGNASKSTILHEAIEYIRQNSARNHELRLRIEDIKAR